MRASLIPKAFLTASLSKSVLCHLCSRTQGSISRSRVRGGKRHSLGSKWEVPLEIQASDLQPGCRALVPRDERQIRDGCLISNEIARGTLGEDRLKDAKDALDLAIVSLDGAGDLLAVEFLEPRGLAKVWSV